MQRHKIWAHCLLLLLSSPAVLADSGSGDADDEPDLPKLSCFSSFTDQVPNDMVTCVLTEPITDRKELTIRFSEDRVSKTCVIKLTERQNCSVPAKDFTLITPCCIRVSSTESQERGPCVLNKEIIHMVKPGTPFNLTATTLMEAKEIKLTWESPKIRFTELTNSLLHQVSYRAKLGTWEHLNVTARSLRLLMKNLMADSRYTIRVRSTADQMYFKGIWSDWSQTVEFQTPAAQYIPSTGFKVTISFLILLFVFLIGLVALLWENRIKPHLWPRIPNPKSALEHLYMKPNKAVEVSFNPNMFLDATEGRVDTIQVKGGRRCSSYSSLACEAAGCNTIAADMELLIPAPSVLEKGAGSVESAVRHCAGEPPEPVGGVPEGGGPEGGASGDAHLVEPERVWAQPSAPPLCPGFEPRVSMDTPSQSPGPQAGDPPDRGAGRVEGGDGVRGLGEVGDAGATVCSVAPPDESYITMSNLYKIQ
uniref:interleukin-7 receptor subunit alpha n=1 Tax=Pristiophorus japonicus TaxID=55135 RepID=UPI00398EFBCB